MGSSGLLRPNYILLLPLQALTADAAPDACEALHWQGKALHSVHVGAYGRDLLVQPEVYE